MISVIVPIYGVEEFLDECVRSIVGQTYSDLEIILVDDGSPDRCPTLCDEWAEIDRRIKVIHKINGGLSDARNAGMEIATGDYIGFVDSDDWIAPTMYQTLLEHLKTTDSDIAACGVQMVWNNGETRMLTKPGSILLDNREAMKALVEETWLKQPVWYKLYRREVVDGILFKRGKCHEDVFWSYQPVARAKRVCVVDTPLYFYRQRSGSIMGEGFSKKRLDSLEGREERLEYLKVNYPEIADEAALENYFFAMYLTQKALKNDVSREIISALLQFAKRALPSKVASKKQRLWVKLSTISFVGTCRLRNLLRVGL